ncbi:hypothetical protein KOR42_27310 [Thalassoglobus neptunius]|uniref:Uncharacterized protein n=1 Tax=Thalassoglobus neptunius TaxID=1938619 RepID=A0A5C5WXC1_9PLAN|nr:hypothetical protein [Thalassoglobus neptunius]TWT55604.1 hypothetical protein KOR42_27310 [Thalassoglobus neptunius]
MFGIKTFFTGLLTGSVGSLLAMQFHVMNTNEGVIVVPRAHQPALFTTYVDVRKWDQNKWNQHPEVVEAAVRSGRTELLATEAEDAPLYDPNATNATNAGGEVTAAEKARLAMDALVPIRFKNDPSSHQSSQGNYAVGSQNAVPWNPQQTYSPAPVSGGQNSNTQGVEQNYASGQNWNHIDVNKMPTLGRPIPYEEPSANVASQPAVVPQKQEQTSTEWVKSLLKSVMPQSDEQASVTTQPQHGNAFPTQQYNPAQMTPAQVAPAQTAPNQSRQRQSPQVPNQPSGFDGGRQYHPAVRPF